MTVLPFSESTEGALIARLLVDPRPIAALSLDPDDFFMPTYRKAYRAMQSLASQRKPIDLETLRQEGCDLGDVLDALTPAHTADPAVYAKIIRGHAFRRRYIQALTDLAERAGHDDDAQALVNALQTETAALVECMEPSETLGRVSLAEYQHSPEPPYFGVLAPQGTTILYGESGDGKSWVAARLVSQLVQAGIKVAVLDFEAQPQEWGHRLNTFGMDLSDVMYFNPPTTMDKWATPEVAAMLKREGVGYLVVDSALYLIDSEDPYSPNSALGYARARRRLNNLPALLLAHVPAGADKIFGSIVWKAECRISWRLTKDFATRRRLLTCRKANGYGWLEGAELTIHFDEALGQLELV